MKNYQQEHRRIKVLRCILISVLIAFLLVLSLHQTSQHMKNYMFSQPEDLQEWEDHIQIAILLRGNLKNVLKVLISRISVDIVYVYCCVTLRYVLPM